MTNLLLENRKRASKVHFSPWLLIASLSIQRRNAMERPEVGDTASDGEITYSLFLSCFIPGAHKNQPTKQTNKRTSPTAKVPTARPCAGDSSGLRKPWKPVSKVKRKGSRVWFFHSVPSFWNLPENNKMILCTMTRFLSFFFFFGAIFKYTIRRPYHVFNLIQKPIRG